jgi:hypothetical protein
MPVISSQYWNMVYGDNAEDAKKDAEGLQTMRTLARNMAWLLKCIDAGKRRAYRCGNRKRHPHKLYKIIKIREILWQNL